MMQVRGVYDGQRWASMGLVAIDQHGFHVAEWSEIVVVHHPLYQHCLLVIVNVWVTIIRSLTWCRLSSCEST